MSRLTKIVATLAATVFVGTASATAVATVAPTSHTYYACHHPKITYLVTNGQVKRQVWCTNPSPSELTPSDR